MRIGYIETYIGVFSNQRSTGSASAKWGTAPDRRTSGVEKWGEAEPDKPDELAELDEPAHQMSQHTR